MLDLCWVVKGCLGASRNDIDYLTNFQRKYEHQLDLRSIRTLRNHTHIFLFKKAGDKTEYIVKSLYSEKNKESIVMLIKSNGKVLIEGSHNVFDIRCYIDLIENFINK